MPVRPATPDDVPAVLPMVAAICAMHAKLDPARYAMLPDVVERYARWLPLRATDPESVFLVAESKDSPPKIVGFLIATIEASIPIYSLERFGFIHDVWVEPEARGMHHASQLTAAAIRQFTRMGIKQVRLETADANHVARKLFAACGFRVATVEMLRDVPG